MKRQAYSQRNIQQIIEFKLMLKDILKTTTGIKPKISQLQSLKNIISLSISKLIKQRYQGIAQKQHAHPKMETGQKIIGAVSQSEYSKVHTSRLWNQSQYCKIILYNACKIYDMKDRINGKLYELQCLNDKVNIKFQRYCRQNICQGQRSMLLKASKINTELVRILTSLVNLKSETVAQNDNLIDCINVLKVKYNILKRITTTQNKTYLFKYTEAKNKNKQIELSVNENNNQFLVNL